MSQTRPNILFIQADQLNPSFLPAYGNSTALTPNLDDLASKSVVFESAYANYPLCAPSRYSMLTGQLPSQIEAFDNGAEFPSSIPTWAHYLKSAGYDTALAGKMHFVGADQHHGFDQRLTSDIYPTQVAPIGAWTRAGQENVGDPKALSEAGPCLRSVAMEYDEEVLHRARRKLFDLARGNSKGSDQPWHLAVSFTHPHDPYQCSYADWDRYDHDQIDMPRTSSVADLDPLSERLMQHYGLTDFPPSDEQIRTARHAYYGSLSYVDSLVGALMQTLRATRLDQNTVIVFTSDHGDMLGERGLWHKRTFYEGAIRVPLLISWPGNLEHGRVDINVSLVDLLPTFLELASSPGRGLEPVEPIAGSSLLPLTGTVAASHSDTVYAENIADGADTLTLMVKTGSLKYMWSSRDPSQLYDLASDPEELRDLALDQHYHVSSARLQTMIHQRWDTDSLTESIARNQARRSFLKGLPNSHQTDDWTYRPPDQTAQHVLRDGSRYKEWAYDDVLR